MKRDGCIPYVFKVYVDKTNDLICLNIIFKYITLSSARAVIYSTHTHQREGERINDARVYIGNTSEEEEEEEEEEQEERV